jgi:hypothetical protein
VEARALTLATLSVCAACSEPDARGTLSATLDEAPGNRVANASFETDGRWNPFQCTAQFEANAAAPHGVRVAHLVRPATALYDFFDVDDLPDALERVDAGVVFHGSAYLAAAVPQSIGKPGFLALRQRNAAGNSEVVASAEVPLGLAFQRVDVTMTTVPAGIGLDVYAGQFEADAGDEVYVDLVQLVPDVADAGTDAGAGPEPAARNLTLGCGYSAGPPSALWAVAVALFAGWARRARARATS